ncbi:HU family DNA-binding protein [Bacteroides faecium]|uniref:DNA-binding protein n=1 Tax=Bacteroides faecium TaxID=2715212 RepID=A0A6H0KQI8_9BACE|nr:HU family DNA-binding protein [Bacteroides faecium]QIU95726.1 DNA-binding protein [Bacteroides faecium]
MATVTVVRYKRRKRIGDEESPMVFALKPKSGEAKIYSIESLAREIESIGALSVEDVSHVMKSFVRAMKKVLVAGNKVKVEGLGIFYTTLTCPGVEVEKDCTVKNITRVNLRFKVDNSLRLANDSTATTRGGDNNMTFELYTDKKSASGGNGGSGEPDDSGKGDGGDGGETPDPAA